MDIEEIKETLSKIEEVLFEGVTTGEEIESTANRVYNVVVKQRNQIIESKQKEIDKLLKSHAEWMHLAIERKGEIEEQQKKLSKWVEVDIQHEHEKTQLKERIKELEDLTRGFYSANISEIDFHTRAKELLIS
jgi:hypothetical protein